MFKKRLRGTALKHDSMGFVVIDEQGGERRYLWEAVVRATAFKRDLLTTDIVCLALELSTERVIEVHEELVGWESFAQSLPDHLSGFPAYESWWRNIALPPFQVNETVLFERQNVTAG